MENVTLTRYIDSNRSSGGQKLDEFEFKQMAELQRQWSYK